MSHLTLLLLLALLRAAGAQTCAAGVSPGTICSAAVTVAQFGNCTLFVTEELVIAGGGALSRDIVFVEGVQSVELQSVALNGAPAARSFFSAGPSRLRVRVPGSARNGSSAPAELALRYAVRNGVLRARRSCNATAWPTRGAHYLSWESGPAPRIANLSVTFSVPGDAPVSAVPGVANFTVADRSPGSLTLEDPSPRVPVSAYARVPGNATCPARIDACQAGSRPPLAWAALPVVAFALCACALCLVGNTDGKR